MNPLCDCEFMCPMGTYTADELAGEVAHLLGPIEYTGKRRYGGDEVLDLMAQIWNIAYQAHRAGLQAAQSVDKMFEDVVLTKLTEPPPVSRWSEMRFDDLSTSETETETITDDEI